MSALTFGEKRKYQSELDDKYVALESGNLPFKEKRILQERIDEIYVILDGKTTPSTEPTLLDRLIKGEFDAYKLVEYTNVLQDLGNAPEWQDNQDELNDSLTKPLTRYIMAHPDECLANPSAYGLTQEEVDAEFGKVA